MPATNEFCANHPGRQAVRRCARCAKPVCEPCSVEDVATEQAFCSERCRDAEPDAAAVRGADNATLEAGLGALPNMIYLLTPKEILPHAVYRWCWLARQALPRKPRPESFVVVYFCEQPPDPASRVQLGPEVDRLGLNRLVLDWRIDDAVSATVLRLQQMFAERLEQTGLGHLENPASEPWYTDASHHLGTARMSADPRNGVVDQQCAVHRELMRCGPASDHRAGQTVCHQDRRRFRLRHRPVELRDPAGAVGLVPIRLLDTARIGQARLPQALPVLRP